MDGWDRGAVPTPFFWPRAALTYEEGGYFGSPRELGQEHHGSLTLGEVWLNELPLHLRDRIRSNSDELLKVMDLCGPIFPFQKGTTVFYPTLEFGMFHSHRQKFDQKFLASGVFGREKGDGERIAEFLCSFLGSEEGQEDPVRTSATQAQVQVSVSLDLLKCRLETALAANKKMWTNADEAFTSILKQFCETCDVIVEKMLDEGHFFLAEDYQSLIQVLVDMGTLHGIESKGIHNHFELNSKPYGGSCSPAVICLWRPSEIEELFRLKTDEEVLSFVMPSFSSPAVNPTTRATRFALPGSSDNVVEVFVFDRLRSADNLNNLVRVQPHFLSLKPGETRGDLHVGHLQEAIAFCHDLGYLSSICIYSLESGNAEAVALGRSPSLIEVASDMSFSVALRCDQKIFCSGESGKSASFVDPAESLVVEKIGNLAGRKLLVIDEEDKIEQWIDKFAPRSEGFQIEPFYTDGDANTHGPEWTVATLAQDGAGFLWLFADPDSETIAGRRNRRNIDNLLTHMRSLHLASPAED